MRIRVAALLSAAALFGLCIALSAFAGAMTSSALLGNSASVAGNAFSAGAWALATNWRNPTANAPVPTAGDGNGYQSNPQRAYTDNNQNAQDANSGTAGSLDCYSTARDKHIFWGYAPAIPGGSFIDGIEVRLDARSNNNNNSPGICVELSWDGGLTWTGTRVTSITNSMQTYVVGGSADLWGRAWTAAEVNQVRIRLTNIGTATNRNFILDWVALKVHYH
ncbi:MAG: hypothetical protein WEC33_06440 [Dehalococcoidia bacterium]